MIRAALLLLLFSSTAAAQTVDLRPYWPAPAAGKQRILQDRNATLGMTVTRRFVPRGAVIALDEFAPGYHATWELQEISGVIEEVGTWLSSTVHLVYVSGKSIPWGGSMAVGTYIDRNVEVDVAASSGVTSGPSNFGYQKLSLLSAPASFTNVRGLTFADVVKIRVYQAWCVDWTCAGPGHVTEYHVDYWLALNLGPIQIEYVSVPGVTPRTDGVDSYATTWETN